MYTMPWGKGLLIKAFFVIRVPPLVTLRRRAHMIWGLNWVNMAGAREGCDGKSE